MMFETGVGTGADTENGGYDETAIGPAKKTDRSTNGIRANPGSKPDYVTENNCITGRSVSRLRGSRG